MTRHPSPPLRYTLTEGRAFIEFGLCLQSMPLLRQAARGDGHPVLVYPGFMAANSSTALLRWFLRDLGYQAEGWCLGRNLGHEDYLEDLNHQLASAYGKHGRKVSLIGWSLGGVFAREVARANPDKVRQVITLGSPFSTGPSGTRVSWIYRLVTGRAIKDEDVERIRACLTVPTTAIYSQTDGIVNWRGCVEEEGARRENIQVHGSHFGLGHNPVVLSVIADRLAQNPERWRPFRPSALGALLFPKHRAQTVRTLQALTLCLVQPLLGKHLD
ncbi:MAG TPA: hypothetical protein VD886_04625 [Herpetosiphonaceae bacterium]|nr:hypothetical protein [Herpetosiphonaceae bacterium]